ncbi:hypothetical protein CSOJ01_10007 [Colletotrichum sojae]|uniref:Uncharacterized protein n=1 Tax=Colletotrichum sojae TaxID=2175907 RepID=A0A8H6J1P9_9PEZI|nr:hypothetical protein CSOJ01_10007 [Colletotrichum sojae]
MMVRSSHIAQQGSVARVPPRISPPSGLEVEEHIKALCVLVWDHGYGDLFYTREVPLWARQWTTVRRTGTFHFSTVACLLPFSPFLKADNAESDLLLSTPRSSSFARQSKVRGFYRPPSVLSTAAAAAASRGIIIIA